MLPAITDGVFGASEQQMWASTHYDLDPKGPNLIGWLSRDAEYSYQKYSTLA